MSNGVVSQLARCSSRFRSLNRPMGSAGTTCSSKSRSHATPVPVGCRRPSGGTSRTGVAHRPQLVDERLGRHDAVRRGGQLVERRRVVRAVHAVVLEPRAVGVHVVEEVRASSSHAASGSSASTVLTILEHAHPSPGIVLAELRHLVAVRLPHAGFEGTNPSPMRAARRAAASDEPPRHERRPAGCGSAPA